MEIFIYDEINPPLAETTAKQLRAKPRDPVEVRINSYGGSATDAVAIYNALQSHGGKVTVTVEGMCYSAATVVACAGRCAAYESAVFGFHAPWSEVAGPASELRDAAQSLDKVSESIARIYAAKTGKPIEDMRQLLTGRIGTWLTAVEARDAGFVNEVIGKTAKLCTGNIVLPARFRMSVENTPQATAKPVMLSPDAIVTLCAEEPGVVASLLAKPHTEAQVKARLADAKEIRAMARLSHQSGPAVDAMIAAGVSPDTAGPQLLRMVAEQDAALPVSNIHTGNVVGFGGYGGDHFMQAATDALVVRMGGKVKDPHPAVRDFQDASLSGMAALCLNASGHSTFGRSRAQIIKMAMTTSDFPELLSSTANKSLVTRFEAMTEHRQLCETATLQDFKRASAVNVSFLPGLLEKKEAEEIKYGSLSDGAESYKLATYARGLVLTR
ncbi:MAG: head maturation protease, ClpP-related, partial [Accumulibacter sp.]|uniref:head maturation protease, ClpP-related n=1 Tax=Accumulibacter sp. TaxID=2053492 RepID=UPI003314ED9B